MLVGEQRLTNLSRHDSLNRPISYLTGLKGHPLLKVQRAGVDYALRLSLSVQQDQYYGSLRDSSGFKVMVHDQEEPPLINELGFAIQPGTHTFCGLRKEVVCEHSLCAVSRVLALL